MAGRHLVGLWLAVSLIGLAVASSPAAGAPRPNLHELKLTQRAPAVPLVPGTRFNVRDVLRNDGRATAKRSSVGYFLSRDRKLSRRDVRLGARAVKPLRAGRTSRGLKALRIPAGTAPGDWRLLACADPRKRVRETSERDNCAALRITVGQVVPGGDGTPPPGGGTPPPGGGPSSPPAATAVTFTTPVEGATTNAARVEFAGSAAPGALVEITVVKGSAPVDTLEALPGSDGRWSAGSDALTADGEYTVFAAQTDAFGRTQTSGRAFRVDRTQPAVALTTPATGTTTPDATPQVSGTAGTAAGDSTTVTVRIYAGDQESEQLVTTLPTQRSGGSFGVTPGSALADGTYTARAEQVDSAGNVGMSASTFQVDTSGPPGDTTSPEVTLTRSPASPNGANGWYTSMPTIHVVADDANFGSLSCTVDGTSVAVTPTAGSTHDAEGNIPVSGDGEHTVACTATDTAGNPATTRQTTFKVDRVAPPVTLTTPSNGATTTLMRFAGASGSGGGNVTVRVWSGTSASGAPQRSQTASPSGGAWSLDLLPVLTDGATYIARAEQTDAAGNTGISATRTFTIPHTLQAAGDIARCGSNGDEATAALLANRAGTVAALGDVVYDDHVNPEGSLANFMNCYEPSWGPLKPRTRPAIGNHEYNADLTATGYFDYFNGVGADDGPAGPRGKGYYSYDKGSWHVVVLNTNNRCQENMVSCSPTSAQIAWLKSDLAANPATCTLAYFHHPRFSSYLFPRGSNDASVKPIWDVLYAAGADVILNGHAHNYERWRPLTPEGAVDDTYGIREFIAGQGGASHHSFTGTPNANSEEFDSTTFGVLEMRLSSGSYSWRFVPAPGTGPYAGESGSASCHGAPPAP